MISLGIFLLIILSIYLRCTMTHYPYNTKLHLFSQLKMCWVQTERWITAFWITGRPSCWSSSVLNQVFKKSATLRMILFTLRMKLLWCITFHHGHYTHMHDRHVRKACSRILRKLIYFQHCVHRHRRRAGNFSIFCLVHVN